MIEVQTNLGSNAINIGAMNCYDGNYLDNGDDAIKEDEIPTTVDMIQDAMNGLGSEEDMDAFFVSAVHGGPEVSIDARHLLKVWQISYEDTKHTIDATTQHGTHHPNPIMNQNYTTNDWMLQYRTINQYFFMDTFFATKKGGTSSRGNTCCQLFITDKGFIYVVPMKRKSEVLLAIKQFAKEVGAPDAIVSDMAREQVSQDVQNFCNTIGTTLRALQEGTSWSYKAELYINLMKEAICKDMREANCPLWFWDYCLEHRVRIYNLSSCDHIKICGSNPHMELLVSRGISPIYANSVGTTGVIFGITRPLLLTTKKYLAVSLGQPEGKGMNCHSGY